MLFIPRQDGSVSRYPLDRYTLQLNLVAFAVDSASFQSCEATLPNFQNPVSFQAGVGQGLQGFSATFQLQSNPTVFPDNPSAGFSLVFNVHRGGLLKFFAIIT